MCVVCVQRKRQKQPNKINAPVADARAVDGLQQRAAGGGLARGEARLGGGGGEQDQAAEEGDASHGWLLLLGARWFVFGVGVARRESFVVWATLLLVCRVCVGVGVGVGVVSLGLEKLGCCFAAGSGAFYSLFSAILAARERTGRARAFA